MKVIITGGTGTLGRALSAKLLAKHSDVIVLSRNPENYRGRLLNGVQVVQWDAVTGEGWSDLIDSSTAIVNLAGESIAGEKLFPPQRWTPIQKDHIRDSRVDAGAAVVDAVNRAEEKPKVVVQSSAIGYYGVNNGDAELSETHPAGDDFLATTCIVWEKATQAVEEMGVRRVVVRTGIVLSNKGGALPKMVLPFKFFGGGPIGSGNQWMSWIHEEDEAAAIVHLIENDEAEGVYNLTAPTPVRNHTLAKAIGKSMGRPAFVQTPEFVFKTAFGEMATVVIDGQRVVPTRLQESGYEFQYPSVQSATDALLKDQ